MGRLYDYVLKSPKITSSYGKRTHPITKEPNKMHYGTDLISTAGNKNLYAIEDGYAQKIVTGQDKATTGYGNYIWVRYPRINLSLMHAHCSKILLKKGDKVKKGDVVAIMGSTGASTGTHLHLGVTKIGSDTWLNPQTIDYTPPEEPKQEDIKTKDELEKLKITVENLTKELNDITQELNEERTHKFSKTILEDGTYSIDLKANEILIIK